MILAVILCSLVLSSLLSIAALGSERIFAGWGWPLRGVWLVALLASATLPEAMLYQFPSMLRFLTRLLQTGFSVAFPGWDHMLDWQALLKELWMTTSIMFVALTIASYIQVRIAARKWSTDVVGNTTIFVSERVGPAVFGFFSPVVVVPRWFSDIDTTTRVAGLAHERQHVEKCDPLLFLVGLALVAVIPWNPAVHWELRRLRFAIEVDCDARVVVNGSVRVRCIYAQALLLLSQHGQSPGAIAIGDATPYLRRRICTILAGT